MSRTAGDVFSFEAIEVFPLRVIANESRVVLWVPFRSGFDCDREPTPGILLADTKNPLQITPGGFGCEAQRLIGREPQGKIASHSRRAWRSNNPATDYKNLASARAGRAQVGDSGGTSIANMDKIRRFIELFVSWRNKIVIRRSRFIITKSRNQVLLL